MFDSEICCAPEEGVFVAEPVAKPKRRSPKFAKARGHCRNPTCGKSLSDKRDQAIFCSSKCRFDVGNRRKKHGAEIIDQVKRWRRASKPQDRGRELTILAKMARDLLDLDDEIGFTHLLPPPTHAAARVVARNIAGTKRVSVKVR